MSSSDLAISVRGLSKQYTIAHEEKHTTLGEKLMARLRNPLHRPTKETFQALRDVSFDVKRGEVLGIIGRNGAGKSTLLKILSRITEPTSGEIRLYGRVASLLEVGTGFHPELTGRENIYLNGAILGMKRAEITRKFDEIVAFAEIEKFLDTPVKRYSSGMYVRLAFAVAAHLEPEILIVDEVLAVGDAEFQKKCLGKMQEVSKGAGRTVLFVSHNVAAVRQLCARAVLLNRGQIEVEGITDGVLNQYVGGIEALSPSRGCFPLGSRTDRTGDGHVLAEQLTILSKGVPTAAVFPHRPFEILLQLRVAERVGSFMVSVDIETLDGTRITSLCSAFKNAPFCLNGSVQLICRVVNGVPLRPDRYSLNVWVGTDNRAHDLLLRAGHLDISPTDFFGTSRLPERGHGTVMCGFDWSVA